MKTLAFLFALLVMNGANASPPEPRDFLALSQQNFRGAEPDAYWNYKQSGDKSLTMAVYLPEGYDTGGPFPTIVFFHGGSWREGAPSMHYPDCLYWAARGMMAVSVNYRLKDRDQVPVPLACVQDAKAAIRYLRENAAQLKIDPDRIVAAGGSAGGQLAAATAMINTPESERDAGNTAISAIPQAIICYNPWFRCAKPLSPTHNVGPDLPPMIIFHGDQDPIPVSEVAAFRQAMAEAGNTCTLYVGKGGKHGFCNGRNGKNPYFYWSLALANQFLINQQILGSKPTVPFRQDIKAFKQEDYLTIE